MFKMLCTKYMASSEVMTSSTHSFAYSYWLVKKCFVNICETSKCHNFLIFQPIFIRFSLLCLKCFTLSSEIKLNLFWSSPLSIYFIHLFLLFRFKSKYGCPISSKITKLYFILNIIQLPSDLKIILNFVPLLNFPFNSYVTKIRICTF